jgi:uncharacterized protein YgiM (DUF1202 family)
MKFILKHLGSYNGNPADTIELTIVSGATGITEELTDNNGYVDEYLINTFRNIVEKLEEHNICMLKRQKDISNIKIGEYVKLSKDTSAVKNFRKGNKYKVLDKRHDEYGHKIQIRNDNGITYWIPATNTFGRWSCA